MEFTDNGKGLMFALLSRPWYGILAVHAVACHIAVQPYLPYFFVEDPFKSMDVDKTLFG